VNGNIAMVAGAHFLFVAIAATATPVRADVSYLACRSTAKHNPPIAIDLTKNTVAGLPATISATAIDWRQTLVAPKTVGTFTLNIVSHFDRTSGRYTSSDKLQFGDGPIEEIPPATMLCTEGATPESAAAAPVPPSTSPPINFTDARPTDELKPHTFSNFPSNCDFGVRTLEADIDQLRDSLAERVGAKLGDRSVVVDHYVIYLNTAAASTENERKMRLAGAAAGVVGGIVVATSAPSNPPTTSAKCDRDKMHGWFDISELTTPWSPLIAEVEIHVDGHDHVFRSVYSPPRNLIPQVFAGISKSDIGDAAMAQVMGIRVIQQRVNAALADQIAEQLR